MGNGTVQVSDSIKISEEAKEIASEIFDDRWGSGGKWFDEVYKDTLAILIDSFGIENKNEALDNLSYAIGILDGLYAMATKETTEKPFTAEKLASYLKAYVAMYRQASEVKFRNTSHQVNLQRSMGVTIPFKIDVSMRFNPAVSAVSILLAEYAKSFGIPAPLGKPLNLRAGVAASTVGAVKFENVTSLGVGAEMIFEIPGFNAMRVTRDLQIRVSANSKVINLWEEGVIFDPRYLNYQNSSTDGVSIEGRGSFASSFAGIGGTVTYDKPTETLTLTRMMSFLSLGSSIFYLLPAKMTLTKGGEITISGISLGLYSKQVLSFQYTENPNNGEKIFTLYAPNNPKRRYFHIRWDRNGNVVEIQANWENIGGVITKSEDIDKITLYLGPNNLFTKIGVGIDKTTKKVTEVGGGLFSYSTMLGVYTEFKKTDAKWKLSHTEFLLPFWGRGFILAGFDWEGNKSRLKYLQMKMGNIYGGFSRNARITNISTHSSVSNPILNQIKNILIEGLRRYGVDEVGLGEISDVLDLGFSLPTLSSTSIAYFKYGNKIKAYYAIDDKTTGINIVPTSSVITNVGVEMNPQKDQYIAGIGLLKNDFVINVIHANKQTTVGGSAVFNVKDNNIALKFLYGPDTKVVGINYMRHGVAVNAVYKNKRDYSIAMAMYPGKKGRLQIGYERLDDQNMPARLYVGTDFTFLKGRGSVWLSWGHGFTRNKDDARNAIAGGLRINF